MWGVLGSLVSGLVQGLLGIFFKQKASADMITQGEQKVQAADAIAVAKAEQAKTQATIDSEKKTSEDAMKDGTY